MVKYYYTRKELKALFKEIREDEAARKREDAHRYEGVTFKNILDGKAEAPADEKAKVKKLER